MTHDTNDHDGDRSGQTDGGVSQAAEDHRQTSYLEQEVNILKPSTAFMRDHLRVIWIGFAAWVLIVFGPVTATAIAPDAMTTQMPVLGFPLHYFLVAIGAPGGALILSILYARKRDQLDAKYGIQHGATEVPSDEPDEAAAADGGVQE